MVVVAPTPALASLFVYRQCDTRGISLECGDIVAFKIIGSRYIVRFEFYLCVWSGDCLCTVRDEFVHEFVQ